MVILVDFVSSLAGTMCHWFTCSWNKMPRHLYKNVNFCPLIEQPTSISHANTSIMFQWVSDVSGPFEYSKAKKVLKEFSIFHVVTTTNEFNEPSTTSLMSTLWTSTPGFCLLYESRNKLNNAEVAQVSDKEPWDTFFAFFFCHRVIKLT